MSAGSRIPVYASSMIFLASSSANGCLAAGALSIFCSVWDRHCQFVPFIWQCQMVPTTCLVFRNVNTLMASAHARAGAIFMTSLARVRTRFCSATGWQSSEHSVNQSEGPFWEGLTTPECRLVI